MTEQAALLDDHNASALRCKTALYGMQLDSERVCNITKVHKTASVWFERLLSMLALKYYMYRRKRGQRPLQRTSCGSSYWWSWSETSPDPPRVEL